MSAHNIVISFKLVANVVISSAQYRRETWKSTLIELNPSWQLPCGTWELCEVTKGENLIELEQGSGVLIDIKENLKQSANHFQADGWVMDVTGWIHLRLLRLLEYLQC